MATPSPRRPERGAGGRDVELTPVSGAELLGYERIACEIRSLAATELVLKENRYFLLTDAAGNIPPAGACELGPFYEDTRVLSHYELRPDGGRPDVQIGRASCRDRGVGAGVGLGG